MRVSRSLIWYADRTADKKVTNPMVIKTVNSPKGLTGLRTECADHGSGLNTRADPLQTPKRQRFGWV